MLRASRSIIKSAGIKSAGDLALCEEWLHLSPPQDLLNAHNNCYSYAAGSLESILDLKARSHAEAAPQPGDGSGIPKNILLLLQYRSLPFWIRMAERDGLRRISVRASDPLPVLSPYERLVVLTYNASSKDFHWLRREQNDLWTHKPGSRKPPTWYDEQRQLIADPRTADLWGYNTVCVFFAVPIHGVDVRMKKDWLRFFNSLDGLVTGQLDDFRRKLITLGELVQKPFNVFSDYLIEMANNGSDQEVKRFLNHLRDGTRLPEADGLLPFDPRYPHVPLNFAWSVSSKG